MWWWRCWCCWCWCCWVVDGGGGGGGGDETCVKVLDFRIHAAQHYMEARIIRSLFRVSLLLCHCITSFCSLQRLSISGPSLLFFRFFFSIVCGCRALKILWLTKPESWSNHAMLAATKVFASNFNDKMAQRFYNIFLLVREGE